jgi:hypothetical protein
VRVELSKAEKTRRGERSAGIGAADPCNLIRFHALWPRTGPEMVAECVNTRIREPGCRQAPEGRQRRPTRDVCRPPHKICRPSRGLESSWGRLSAGYHPRLPSVTPPTRLLVPRPPEEMPAAAVASRK